MLGKYAIRTFAQRYGSKLSSLSLSRPGRIVVKELSMACRFHGFLAILFFSMISFSRAEAQTPDSNIVYLTKWQAYISSEVTVTVTTGQWIEIDTVCQTGGWDKCDQPEYLSSGSYTKMPQIGIVTGSNGVTEQIFGMFAPFSGTITIQVPVVYYGILYNHTLEIKSGPS